MPGAIAEGGAPPVRFVRWRYGPRVEWWIAKCILPTFFELR